MSLPRAASTSPWGSLGEEGGNIKASHGSGLVSGRQIKNKVIV
jgi:hypothetical protein